MRSPLAWISCWNWFCDHVLICLRQNELPYFEQFRSLLDWLNLIEISWELWCCLVLLESEILSCIVGWRLVTIASFGPHSHWQKRTQEQPLKSSLSGVLLHSFLLKHQYFLVKKITFFPIVEQGRSVYGLVLVFFFFAWWNHSFHSFV